MRIDARITSISAAVAVAGLLLAGAPPGDDRRSGRIEAAASAIPTAAEPVVADHSTSSAHAGRAADTVVAAAVATSDCDGCEGTSTVFQVIHFDANASDASADNSAAAWSSCTGCTSSAVSVQLLVVRDPARLTVNNRALAVNAECDACTTSAAAIQFVLAGGTKRELTARTRDLIAQVEAQLADRLADAAGAADASSRQAGASSATGLVDEAATELERIIRADLGTSSSAGMQRAIDVQLGG
jgi:hypothetical protein